MLFINYVIKMNLEEKYALEAGSVRNELSDFMCQRGIFTRVEEGLKRLDKEDRIKAIEMIKESERLEGV